MKFRREEEANYTAFHDGRMTIRMPIDSQKPITELRYAEFYDVSLGEKCVSGGGCPWCYTSADKAGRNYMDPAQRVLELWGPMPASQRPFQVAIGGGGEPLEHSQFVKVLQTFKELGITPNYTTNGRLWFKPGVMEATRKYCGGVAISCHPHLERDWRKAIEEYLKAGVSLNLHVIIGDRASSERFSRIYDEYAERLDYVVLLPMVQSGRGASFSPPDTEALLEHLQGKEWSRLAFGSGFWEWLKTQPQIPAVLYPPEIMSKYVLLDSPVRIYNNSHEMREVQVVRNGQPMPALSV
jgi:hypothetical protein